MNPTENGFAAISEKLQGCIMSLIDEGHPPVAIVGSLLGLTAQIISTGPAADHAPMVRECCAQLASAVQRLHTRDQQGSNAQGLPS